jgi:uncharacterized protein (TIGR02594 family)
MNRVLTAGAVASGLLFVSIPAEARTRLLQALDNPHPRFARAANKLADQIYDCDDRGCRQIEIGGRAPERTQRVGRTGARRVDRAVGVTGGLGRADGVTEGLGDRLVMIAQSQLGNGAIYGRATLWCGRFMNWALARAGYSGTGSDMAKSFLSFPHTTPHVGAIAVFNRGGKYGHVGIVTGFDAEGNPIIISGNHGHRVARGVYPRRRVLAYVAPR